MIDSDLSEQIIFWDERIYPILGFDNAFSNWLEFCVQYGTDRSRGQPAPHNAGEDIKLSDNSFSIKEDPREHNKVDSGRCFSAIYDPANERREEFLSFASEFVDSPPELNLDDYLAYGLGIDAESNEKKLYYIKNSKHIVLRSSNLYQMVNVCIRPCSWKSLTKNKGKAHIYQDVLVMGSIYVIKSRFYED